MKKVVILGIVAVVLLALIGGTVMAKGGSNKAARGDLSQNARVIAWQSHSYDPVNANAGAIIESSGQIEGIGQADVNLKMAYTWDLDFYGFNKQALMYAYGQSGAPLTLTDTKGDGPYETPWPQWTSFPTTHRVVITDEEGNVLVLDIVHGVVHEGRDVYWAPPDPSDKGTENEWLIGLEVNGGESTGKFAGESGNGIIRLVVISNNHPDILGSKKYIAAYDIYLKLGEVLLPPLFSY